MFAGRYYADRYFAARYFPKVGADVFLVEAPIDRMWLVGDRQTGWDPGPSDRIWRVPDPESAWPVPVRLTEWR